MKKLSKYEVAVELDSPELCREALNILTTANEKIFFITHQALEDGEVSNNTSNRYLVYERDEWIRESKDEWIRENDITNRTLITIDELRSLLLGDDFIVPEKWYIRGCEELEKLLYNETNMNGGYEHCLYYHLNTPKNTYLNSQDWRYSEITLSSDYVEITVEQFKKYILNEVNKPKVVYTIQDLREGRCAVLNNGTVSELHKVLEAAKPNSSAGYSGSKYYHMENGYYWCNTSSISNLNIPTQSVKKFLKQIKEVTYAVTRDQLKEIYDIACADWQEKINEITKNALGNFNDEGTISEELVNQMRKAATTTQRPVIDRIFPMPKKKIVKEIIRWANVYSNGDIYTHPTEESAKENAGNTIATGVEVRGTYEVEE